MPVGVVEVVEVLVNKLQEAGSRGVGGGRGPVKVMGVVEKSVVGCVVKKVVDSLSANPTRTDGDRPPLRHSPLELSATHLEPLLRAPLSEALARSPHTAAGKPTPRSSVAVAQTVYTPSTPAATGSRRWPSSPIE